VKRSTGTQPLDVGAVRDQAASGLPLGVVLAGVLGEAVVGGVMDLLASRELELGVGKSHLGDLGVLVVGADGDEDGADVHAGGGGVGLTVGATHTGLETIRTGAGKHLVDAQNVIGMDADAHVEEILTGLVAHHLVRGNTSGLEGFARDLFVLIRDEMDAGGELVSGQLLLGHIVDTDLGIRDTTTVPGLRVRLVFTVSVTASGTATHVGKFVFSL